MCWMEGRIMQPKNLLTQEKATLLMPSEMKAHDANMKLLERNNACIQKQELFYRMIAK